MKRGDANRLIGLVFTFLMLACAQETDERAATRSDGAEAGDSAWALGDLVWSDTPILEHTRDFLSLADYLNPALPSNWLSPINYADGEVSVRIELIEVARPSSVPIYYLVGWSPDDGSERYIRGGARFDQASGVVEERVPVKSFQKVVNGRDAGDVNDDWNWSKAFRTPNGDTWGSNGAPYPLKVKVRLTLHPRP